jgi:magnesium transporter
VVHAVDYQRAEQFTTTELDLILGRNFVVTFHRQPLKAVQATIERYLKNPAITVRGPDRFAHAILDLMIENYRPALEELRRAFEQADEGMLRHAEADTLFPRVVALRKELSQLRRITHHQREIVSGLAQGKNRFIRPVIVPYFRDLQEELARIEEQAAMWSEQLILSFRVYLNRSSHEANEGIRMLTALTALTIPVLTVGAWYGMNFKYLPEKDTLWGYPAAIAATVLGTLAMLWVMKRRKWL